MPAAPSLLMARRGARVSDDEIRQRVSAAIIDQRLPPGQPLPEETLAAAFGVSRTVVRRALIRLTNDKLVVLRRHRGAAVARPTIEEAQQVFEARRVVESALVARIVTRLDDDHKTALRAHIAAEYEASERGDFRTGLRLSGAFHIKLATLSGNAVLAEYLRELVSRTSLILALYERRGRGSPCAGMEHAHVLEAIAGGEVAEAQAAMVAHLRNCESHLALADADSSVDLVALFGTATDTPRPSGTPRPRPLARD